MYVVSDKNTAIIYDDSGTDLHVHVYTHKCAVEIETEDQKTPVDHEQLSSDWLHTEV